MTAQMIPREMQSKLTSLSQVYPVVTVMGPRQSGKTTLVRMTFPNHAYVSLENLDMREMAQRDPHGFLRQYHAPVILDEIQRVPSLLSYIQTQVDEDRHMGQYILTGSHQPSLGEGVSQSLAGRTGVLCLLPLSMRELKQAGHVLERDEYLYQGFMPRLYDTALTAEDLYRDYFATYVERDVRQMLNIRNMSAFELFVKLLAGRVGQLVNLTSLSGDVGVSVSTLRGWLSVLEASHLVFCLPCYYENFGKRLTKSHKLYFTEVGLATWLLGITSPEQVSRDPLLGGLFENLVVMEALKAQLNVGKQPNLYFFRDNSGLEVDLLVQLPQRRLLPLEIKSAFTWSSDFCRNLIRVRKLSEQFLPGKVVYSGTLTPTIQDIAFVHFRDVASIVTPEAL